MVMRGKFLSVILLMVIALSLTSCVKRIECPADELRMYAWSNTFDNGDEVALTFTQTNGYLDIDGDDPLHIGGLCMLTDDSLLIFDEQSGMNYSFRYRLYGDRVELSRDGSMMILEK